MNEKETIIIRVRAYTVTHPCTGSKVLAVHSLERFTPEGALPFDRWIRRFVRKQTSDELEAVGWRQVEGTCHPLVCPERGDCVQEYMDCLLYTSPSPRD